MQMQIPDPLTAEEFDRRFDAGEDMGAYLNPMTARPFLHPAHATTFSVAIPAQKRSSLADAASREGLPPEALLQRWISERLETLP